VTRDAASWRDEIALREASLADARREAELGELTPAQLADIEARETRALSAAREGLAAASESVAPRAPRRRRRAYLVVAGLAFAAAIVVLLISALGLRQPGTSDTGAVNLDRAQKVAQLLGEAEADTLAGDEVAALSAYAQVLALDAHNVTALTQTGWLDFSAGSASHNATLTRLGVGNLREAIARASRNPAPRLYYAIAAASTPGNAALARAQFRVFLTLHPSAAQRALAAPYLMRLGLSG
jgi:hypothetical protein